MKKQKNRLFLLFIASFLFGANSIFAQVKDTAIIAPIKKDTSYWVKSAQTGFSFNQASFSDTWRAGGVNSIALGLFLNGKANYLKGNISWDNAAIFEYGFVKNKGQSLRKSNDRMLLDTKYGYKISKNWNLFASLNFLSQFAEGYTFTTDAVTKIETQKLISNLFSPAFLSETMGFEYKPVTYFWARFGVASMRQTFVLEDKFNNNKAGVGGTFDQKVNYGVQEGKSIRNEVGLMRVEADFNKEIMKNILLQAHFVSFTTYEDPLATDVRLDAAIIAKINKYANVKLGGTLFYDQDQIEKLQWTQMMTLNFAVNF